jgi:hypothetical protein
MDNKEGTIIAWENGLVAFEHALGRACMECDAERAQVKAVRQDYLARTHAFMSVPKLSINFNRTL